MLRSRLLTALAPLALATLVPRAHAEKFIQPTPEELHMTAEPKAPGAPAIYLFREQITEDDLHTYSVHARIKVLTDAGKDFGTVEIPFVHGGESGGLSVTELAARTIHPDGTVIPFSGKPYDKFVAKENGAKYMARVFSLPDVAPGSILEYTFHIRWDDSVFFPTDWYLQDDDLYTRKVHYLWHPTQKELVTHDHEQLVSAISWTQILPSDIKLQNTEDASHHRTFELTGQDIPATPHEDFMPPVRSFSYRVLFYYTPYRTGEEFWSKEGKFWEKRQEHFIGSDGAIRSAAAEITAGATTPEMKLRALYSAMGKLENTDYTREHSKQEDKADGLKASHTAADIWARKRGSSDQINGVFVAMARAAGFKAWTMSITPRSHSIFYANYLSLGQLRDDIAVVEADTPLSIADQKNGQKLLFLDPGTRFCPFGHLAWQHTMSGGLREVDGGAVLAQTPADSYKASNVKRIADLTLDEHGVATGTVSLTYTGSPAVAWRTLFARNDEETLRHDLTERLQHLMPGGMEIKLINISNLDQPEQPLVARFSVKGAIGTPTGKRLMVPAALFESNTHPTFPHEKREQPISFDYPFLHQDAVRIKLPAGMEVESMPEASKASFRNFAAYALAPSTAPDSFTMRRDYVLGEVLFKNDEYPELRKFYSSMESSDQASIVLKQKQVASAPAATPAPAPAATPTKPGN